MTRLYTFCLLLCLGPACMAQDLATIHLKDSAHLFGRGSVSNGDFTYNTSFTPDGNTVYFSKATMNWAYIAIFYATREDDEWSTPRPVSFTGVYRDTDPFVSPDGKRLYFCSDRPLQGKPFKDFDYHLFYVELKGNAADPSANASPTPVPLPLPEGMKLLYPSFADNGDLYFCASDSSNDSDIYSCAFVDGAYQPPVRLPFNDKHLVDIDPVVARDESFIIFTSVNRKGFGFVDLWVSFKFKRDNEWSAPINMGNKINSPGRDAAPGLSPDNKKFYFSATRETVKERPTHETIDSLLHSPADGMPQIYEIDISDLKE